MGKKYRIKICGNEAGRVEHNDIVELEEVEEKKKVCCNLYKNAAISAVHYCSGGNWNATSILNGYTQLQYCPECGKNLKAGESRPEELGLVRIEDVLKIVRQTYSGRCIPWSAYDELVRYKNDIEKAIEGMKG